MKNQTQKDELIGRLSSASLAAGSDVTAAKKSVDHVIDLLDELSVKLDDPSERMSWGSVRNAWLEVRASVDLAVAKFKKG